MLPNWLYGKSKSKLASILGGGGTPADYDQVKAQVTQNTEGILALSNDLGEIGAVNFLNHTATSRVENGITFTVNADRSITANGTTTAEEWFSIAQNVVLSESARASGCPKGGSQSTYFMTYSHGGNSYRDNGDGVIIPSGTISNVYIVIKPNVTVNNIVFKPMVSPLSYNGPYVPYAMTNRELTDDVTSLDKMYNGKTLKVVSNLDTPLELGYSSFAINSYASNSTNTPSNGTGAVLTWSSSDKYGAQLAFNNGGLFFRTNNNGTKSAWTTLTS